MPPSENRFPHRVLIVASVSTGAQANEEKYTIATQLANCRARMAQRPHWTLVDEVVIPGHTRWVNWLHVLVASCPKYAEIMGYADRG